MRVSFDVAKKKSEYLEQLVAENPGMSVIQISQTIKRKFGTGLSLARIREARQNAQSMSTTRQRPTESRVSNGEMMDAVLVDRDVEDLMKIIMKRLPGLERLVVTVDEDGEVKADVVVNRRIRSELSFKP